MPVTSTTVLEIVCDNPACPGNTLPVDDRAGWTFVHTEVYGQPSEQFVFCSPTCAASIDQALTAREADDGA